MSAPLFALVAGLLYVVAGFSGFMVGVDGVLNAAHLVLGFWGLFAWSGALSAVNFARGIACAGLALLLIALFGPLDAPSGSGILYGATAALGSYFGFRSLARRERRAERRHNLPNRRTAVRAVVLERRLGAYDRRQARYGGSTLAAG